MPVKELVKAANLPYNLQRYVGNMVYVGVAAYLLEIEMDEIKAALAWNFGGKTKPIELNWSMVNTALRMGAGEPRQRPALPRAAHDRLQRGQGADGRQHGRRPGRALARRLLRGLVSDHTFHQPGGGDEHLRRVTAPDPETGKADLRHRAGRGRAGRRGHDAGRRLGGRTRHDGHQRPRHQPHGRVHRLRLLCRDSGVFWDIQRMGPSTGLPTRTSQGDILSTYYLSHGDTRHIDPLPGQTRTSASRWQARPSIWPNGCKRRSSC
jgi:2-oxoglutarate ferredoxin oxidoreductase subunit alpha